MDENIIKYGQENFSLPHDVVKLPSGGKFYANKKKTIKVGYMTASDENILLGSNSNDMILNLLRSKIYEPDLRPEDMINGDLEAVLLFLRTSSFGPEYTFSLTDPKNGKKFERTIVLDELNLVKPEVEPSEDGTWTTILPKTQTSVTLKPLTFGDSMEINKMAETYPQNRVVPVVTWRLQKQIVAVGGDNTTLTIAKFIESLPIMDSKYIRKFLEKNEPNIDLKRTVLAPSGEKVDVEVTFGAEFFRIFF